MQVQRFEEDVEIISKLGDDPNIDDGLSADALKAQFDEGSRLIKKFLNETVVPALNDRPSTADLPAAIEKEVYAEKALTQDQQDQARKNIGAAANSDLIVVSQQFERISEDVSNIYNVSNDLNDELNDVKSNLDAAGLVYYYDTLPDAVDDAGHYSTLGNLGGSLPSGNISLRRSGQAWEIKLLADCEIYGKLAFSNDDFILDLNGYTLTLATDAARLHFDRGTHAVINGNGGRIVKTLADGAEGQISFIQGIGASLAIHGGEYAMTGDTSTARRADLIVTQSAKFEMIGARLLVDNAGSTMVNGIYSMSPSALIRGCDIRASCAKSTVLGIGIASGKMEIYDSTIFTDAANNTVGQYNGIESNSSGIYNMGELHAFNCIVYGTHSGMQAYEGSKNYIAGGVFDSCSHGGVYISTGPEGVFHAVDATIRCGRYKGKYDSSQFANGYLGGFYMGGVSGSVAFMDGCAIFSEGGSGFVLRGTDGETGLALYISNSSVTAPGNAIRVDDATDHLYVGANTNITTAMGGVLADRTTFAEESYRKIFGDWNTPYDSTAALASDISAVDDSSAIVAESTGSSIAITDASNRPLRGLTLYGKTIQAGTPAPGAPVEMVSVGSAGTIRVTVAGQSVTAATPNGLPGLPVASGGNYVGENGQQWLCDTIDLCRGVYVQRIVEKVLTGNEGWFGNTASYAVWVAAQCAKDALASTPVMCTHYVGVTGGSPRGGQISISNAGSVVIKDPAIGADSAAIKTYLAGQNAAGTPVRVRYALAVPVETPLDLQGLAALRTVKTNTNVANDAGAGMKVAYVADTKAYIDNKFAALSAAVMNA